MSFWGVGCVSGAFGVALGAFGSHGLPRDTVQAQRRRESWLTASQYQLVHSVAILGALLRPASLYATMAATAFSAGILLFSGSIYGLVLLSEGSRFRRILGPATPIGGLCFIAGWSLLALA